MGDRDEWQPPADLLAFLDMVGGEPLWLGYEPVYQRELFPTIVQPALAGQGKDE